MTRAIFSEGCREFDAPSGRRYYARNYRQGGSFDLSPSDAKALVAMGGALVSEAGTTSRRIGFRCTDCGFGSFVRTCSKCGGTCEREGVAPAANAAAAGVAQEGEAT